MTKLRTDTIINRDALYALRELPEESVHCCVTSPPYYALRDYGLDMQIGRANDLKERSRATRTRDRKSVV